MIQDLHSHTYYSFCGKDKPEKIVEAAIAGGIELFGITDHNYGVGNARGNVFEDEEIPDNYERTLVRYYDHMKLIKEKYADQICVLCGIEVATLKEARYALPDTADISFFDYCLIEHISDMEKSIADGDLFSFAKRCQCPAGIAHTDMFGFIRSIGEKPEGYFRKMAEAGIFWEMNVSYDSIHNYREHPYMLEFFYNEEQQEIVRKSGVRLSVGFDGHRVEDYLPRRVTEYCRKITDMGIKLAFEE